jgi:hypothetical protein
MGGGVSPKSITKYAAGILNKSPENNHAIPEECENFREFLSSYSCIGRSLRPNHDIRLDNIVVSDELKV